MKKIILLVVLAVLAICVGCKKIDPVLSETNVTMHVGERLTLTIINSDGSTYLGPHLKVESWSVSDNLTCGSADSHWIDVEATKLGTAWVEAVMQTCNGKGSNGKTLRCDITVLEKELE